MADFLDQNGASRMWGAIKVFFQGRAALTPADDDKIMVIDDNDTETVNGATYKKYKTLTLANLASYISGKISSSFAALASPTFTGTPAAPTATQGTNTTQIATTAYVQTEIANIAGGLIYKGTLGTGGDITALPTTYKVGWQYKIITAGTYAGQTCEVGDFIVAIVARTGSGNLDADWSVIQANLVPPGSLSDATIDSLIV